MPNPTWQREHQEFQEFQAWKLEMNKNLVQGIQPQAQAPSFLAEPSNNVDASGEVVNNPHSTVQHQLVLNKVDIRTRISPLSVSKHARSTTAISSKSLSLPRDYPRGISKVAGPTPSNPIKVEDRPVQAQDLANV